MMVMTRMMEHGCVHLMDDDGDDDDFAVSILIDQSCVA